MSLKLRLWFLMRMRTCEGAPLLAFVRAILQTLYPERVEDGMPRTVLAIGQALITRGGTGRSADA